MTLAHGFVVKSSLELWIGDGHTGGMTTTTHRTGLNGGLTRTLADKVEGLRDDLRTHREAAAQRRLLRRELAAYDTPAAIEDLLVAVDRSADDPDAETIRRILHGNLVGYRRREALAS